MKLADRLHRGSWIWIASTGLLLGTSLLGIAVERTQRAPELAAGAPVAGDASALCGFADAEAVARRPMSMEPPGGPILWGFERARGTPVAIRSNANTIRHGSPSGTLIWFTNPSSCVGELTIVRTAPAPRTTTRRDLALVGMNAYVPNGTYELSTTCDGEPRSSRLVVETVDRVSARQAR